MDPNPRPNPLRHLTALSLIASLGAACSIDATSVGMGPHSDGTIVVDDGDDSTTQSIDGPSLPATPYNYSQVDYPAHFRQVITVGPFTGSVLSMDNTPADNPVTDAGATLGRVLFYDTELSQNGTVSCGSCHQQSHGFADPATLSLGFDGGETGRHSMGLANARFYQNGRFFWDERAASLEEQVLGPLQDEVEMGMTLDEVVARVRDQGFYGALFENAFGDDEVTVDRISRALAQFVRSMVSFESRYDTERAREGSPIPDFPGFTAQENRGKRIFFGDGQGPAACAGCHISEAMVQPAPFNNGLDAQGASDDLGVFDHDPRPQNLGAFKSPSLRNIAVRPPYMHDGRFDTLREVVDHYSDGIQDHPNLGPGLAGPIAAQGGFNFSEQDKEALVAFLRTLTDDGFINDPRFSDPFAD